MPTTEAPDKVRKEIVDGLARIQRSIDDSRDDFDRLDRRGQDTSDVTRSIEALQKSQRLLAARLGPEEAERVLAGLG